jgi:acetyltransferase-like isoleucine patch superfamily enzyme
MDRTCQLADTGHRDSEPTHAGTGPLQRPLWYRCIKRFLLTVLTWHLPVNRSTRWLAWVGYYLHVTVANAVRWALRFCWFEPLFRSQCTSVGRRLRMEQLPFITGVGTIILGDDVELSGKSSIAFSNRIQRRPAIIIGSHTFLGHNCTLNVGAEIYIGEYCLIAGGVRIADFDGHPIVAAERRAHLPTPPDQIRPIRIGDDVWIGAGAIILKGVSIGDRSIIGAGAVVSKNVPSDTVVAGNPARIVKELPRVE